MYSFPCYGILKALNLFLNKYIAKIQLPGNDMAALHTTEVIHIVLSWLAISDHKL
jgi:hypothetical protein